MDLVHKIFKVYCLFSFPFFLFFFKYPAALHIGLFALIEVDVSLSKVGGEN